MMNYIDLAKNICDEMLKYSVTNESIYELYNIIYDKYAKNFNLDNLEKSEILVNVIHFITVSGYDIECIKPVKFNKFMD